MNINERTVPIFADKKGKPGIAFKNTETGEVSGWTAKDDITPQQQSELDAYNTKQGKYGYRLDPERFKKDRQQQAQQAAAIQRQQNLEAGSRKQGESTADFHRRLRQQLDADKPTTRDTAGDDTTRGEVKQPPKPAAKTYDVDGEKLTKTQINTRYNELRKQAGGLKSGSDAEKFGMSANQAIFGKNFAKPKTPNPMMTKYKHPSVEAYDVVLDYLLSEGHADTVEEAHYVMMQLDSEFIQNIIEN